MDSSMRRLQLSIPQCRLGLQSCGRFANKRQEIVAQLDAFTSRIPDSKFLFQVCVSIPIILLFQSYQQPDVSGCSCRRRTAFRRVDLLHSLCQREREMLRFWGYHVRCCQLRVLGDKSNPIEMCANTTWNYKGITFLLASLVDKMQHLAEDGQKLNLCKLAKHWKPPKGHHLTRH